MSKGTRKNGYLNGARVYLSGPMDFVASRAEERRSGWRVRVSELLRSFGATVFDPWFKPDVRGFHEYGKEDIVTIQLREEWTFEATEEGAKTRAHCAQAFWETMHVDLRMVDISDFVIAYCPTNIYSVGTPHEIITARQQHKPVLFVSTPVEFPALDNLRKHLADKNDEEGQHMLAGLIEQVPIKPNPRGVPSLWYMPLIGGEHFFDGFGFGGYAETFNWSLAPSDERERLHPPARPLLPFLQRLNKRLPSRWSTSQSKFVRDDDWLLLDLGA